MLIDVDDCQLVLVDYQARLMPAIHEAGPVLANAVRLGKVARLLDVPVWGTEENPAGLGENVPEVRALCQRTLAKMSFSACADGLIEWLRPLRRGSGQAAPQRQGGNVRSLPRHLQKPAPQVEDGRNTVVLAGCETHVCLMQTALELLEAEFDVVVVTDACSSRTERSRDAAFDRLASAGAELVTTEMVAFEWLRSADHPDFKAVLQLIR